MRERESPSEVTIAEYGRKIALAGREIKFLSGKAKEKSPVLSTDVTREGLFREMHGIALSLSQKPGGCAPASFTHFYAFTLFLYQLSQASKINIV